MIQAVAVNQPQGFWKCTKRTLYIASIYFRMVRDYDPSPDTLEEVNRIFYLVNDMRVLWLPATFARVFWKDQAVERVAKCMSDGNLRSAAETLYAVAPRWLRYNGIDTMMADTLKVLKNVLNHTDAYQAP